MSSHLRPVATMPGVLIDESDSAGPDTRALFYAAETPTQADVIRTARWLGVDPLQHAYNLDLNFSELEPGDLAALGYRLPFGTQPSTNGVGKSNPFPVPEPEGYGPPSYPLALILKPWFGPALIVTAIAAGYIWERWAKAWFASW